LQLGDEAVAVMERAMDAIPGLLQIPDYARAAGFVSHAGVTLIRALLEATGLTGGMVRVPDAARPGPTRQGLTCIGWATTSGSG